MTLPWVRLNVVNVQFFTKQHLVVPVPCLGLSFEHLDAADTFYNALHSYFASPGHTDKYFITGFDGDTSETQQYWVDVKHPTGGVSVRSLKVDPRVARSLVRGLQHSPYFFVAALKELTYGQHVIHRGEECVVAKTEVLVDGKLIRGQVGA